jgi:lysophospholipase L1-like esterase
MLLSWNHPSIRIIGRWDRRNPDRVVTTNPGGIIEIAYYGEMLTLRFDVIGNEQPRPHLWIQVDNGVWIESVLEPYLHIQSPSEDTGFHYLRVIFKSAVEEQNRWSQPLVGKVSFLGVVLERPGILPERRQKVIEFVGDSITEGVLIDTDCGEDCQATRVYQDDVCATYAWLTAERLGLEPRFMGFGGVGVTKGGMGGVPKASLAYPFVYDKCPLNEPEPDFILINHGANDRQDNVRNYIQEYYKLLKVIREINPHSQIFCVGMFFGLFLNDLRELIEDFNREYNDRVIFVDTKGWISPDPLHPLREGHRRITEKLVQQLRPIIFCKKD